MSTTIKENIAIPKVQIIPIGNGIIENAVEAGAHIDKEDILKIKESNLLLSKGRKYAVLVTAGFLSTISKEARELSASKEFANETVAKALIANSIGQRLVVNFYMRINKPAIKTKSFTCREKALKWLNSQLKAA